MTQEIRNNIISKSFLIRAVEERLLTLFKEGKINGTVHTCIGQELIGATIAEFLNENDFVVSNHRGHGHFLSRNNDLVGFFAEIMGKENGICGGLGGSQHLYTKNHISNGIQGGMTPIAAGIAMANKLKNNNEIVVCFIGDGTLGEGIIYEAFNIASLWNLPIVYVLENNGIAQSTSSKQTFSGAIEQRITGFGLDYFSTNTFDLEDLYSTFEQATTLTRKEQKAVFIEVETFRLASHSKGDDNRNEDEIYQYQLKDILNRELTKNKDKISHLLTSISKKIDAAIVEVETFHTTKVKPSKPLVYQSNISYVNQQKTVENYRINKLIHFTLKKKFIKDKNTILLGEDIEYLTPYTEKPYGGAFKVSGNLSELFSNVKNTPISEAAIIGLGTGLALKKMTPIVEIMFGDFMTLTFDQIYNHACKFHTMFNGLVSVPLIIRTPMGGKRGYGPTHSQSLEKHFLGIPNLTVIALNYRVTPEVLYQSVFLEENPTLIIENKVLYTKKLQEDIFIGYQVALSNESYPTVKIQPEKRKAHLTILCYGEVLEDVEKAIELAFEEEEIFCEVICPTKICPINVTPIFESVKKTKKLLIVEEGTNMASYSSEIVTQIIENNIPLQSLNRLSNNEIIPSSIVAEGFILPNKKSIFKKIKEAYYV